MIDPSSIAGGIEITERGWALLEYIRSVVHGDVIAAYFRYDGTRIEGSEKLTIKLHPMEGKPAVWWYSVTPVEDYVFVREPVTPSCAHEIVGQIEGESQPDSSLWRWIAPVLPGRIYGGDDAPPNLKVDFMVFGYRPKALLKHFGET